MADLEIHNLHVRAGEKEILRGLDLEVSKGEIHALMGPNGSGKSTLANTIMGHPNLDVTEGQIVYGGEDITEAAPDERARMGLFMAFQYPVAVPGVTVTKYLRTVLNACDIKTLSDLTTDRIESYLAKLRKKPTPNNLRSPLARQAVAILRELQPFDETDSGLDIDALRVVAGGVNAVAGPDMGVLIITHYQRILHLVQPSHVHVIYEGRIVKEGGADLVGELESKGYGWIAEEVAAA